MSLTQAEILAALHDAMLDAVKTRATVSAINELSESPAAAEKQFEAGLTELVPVRTNEFVSTALPFSTLVMT